MPLTLACLHTAESNALLFQAAAAALPGGALALTHRVRPDLLRDPTPETLEEAAALLREMAQGADAVLLTCSTIGDAAAHAQDAPRPVLRADAALAEAATRRGGLVEVLYAAPTTEGPTRSIFEAAARKSGAQLRLHLVEGAWPLFQAGETAAYHARIAEVARPLPGRVVLAQASMAGASALLPEAPPLTVPAISVMAAARAALKARDSR
ncbi:hypothetical protein KTR66_11000 [Roseococcus sp. SDR]|uniref:hypothetical protein n=1 Tax=Roseococcus sp. SDR TaxID=2835532 RepID=UPI001BD09793|nr:hypothetical protein [Roseococcus sp. SDR]MBS7790527.1 hypothetical protein [Roseococcus sp. SDR]MBV1845841.1 hypothetical protein [Roseococcus sp. SDR]